MVRTVLVTGATSGFGAAIARRFIGDGWKVVATGRRADRLNDLANELGSNLVPAIFDVSDGEATDTALGSLRATVDDVDLLVNNAGLALGVARAPETSLQDWMTMINTNVTGLVGLTHKLLPTLVRRRGAIINLSSIAATYPYPHGNVYAATKAFVTQFSLGLRSDLHGTGVRVTSIEPGMAETEFTLVRNGGDQSMSEEFYKGVHPLTPEDIAESVFWVAGLPVHVNINRLEMMPVNQSWGPFQVHRQAGA